MSSDKKKNPRKVTNFLIFPRFQLSMVAMITGIILLLLSYIFYQVYTSYEILDTLSFEYGMGKSSSFRQILTAQFDIIKSSIYLSSIVGIAVVFVYIVVFTHLSAGAIYNLKNYFKEIHKSGYTKKLTFRKGDLYEDLPEIVNDAIDKIRKD